MNKKFCIKFIVCALVVCSFILNNNYAIAYDDIGYDLTKANEHYDKGMAYLNQRQYAKAIEELKRALKLNPKETSIVNNLSVAYSSRGTYYYNKNISIEKAANDYRSSLYYLKYYNTVNPSEVMNDNIRITEENLKNILIVQKQNLSPEARFKKAKELRGQGEFIPAAIEFIAASQNSKLAYESFLALGDIMRILQENSKSAIYYDKALSINQEDPDLHLKFARVLYSVGNIEDAVNEFNIAANSEDTKSDSIASLEKIWKEKVKENPNDATAHMNLGAVYQKKGDYDGAMAEYKTAQILDPQNPVVRLNIATLFQQQGNYMMALKSYDSIIAVYPTDALAHYYKASVLKKLGRINEAITQYEMVMKLEPNNQKAKNELIDTIKSMPTAQSLNYMYNMAVKNPKDYYTQYNFAYMLHSNKRNDEAIAYYQRAIQANPKFVDSYINIATIYNDKGMHELAMEYLAKANSISPNNAQVNKSIEEFRNAKLSQDVNKASEFYSQKRYQEALNIYLAMKEKSAEVYLGIGACYQAMENYDEAINAYKSAVQEDSSNPNSYHFLGLAYYYKKDFEHAGNAFKKAKELDPINPDIQDAIDTLAYAQSEVVLAKGLEYYNSQQYSEALKYFNQAIQKSLINPYAYYYRAMVYDVLKKYNEAIADYKKVLGLTEDMKIAYYALAVDYDLLNNKAEAKNMYQKFIEVASSSDDEYTKYAKQRLEELK